MKDVQKDLEKETIRLEEFDCENVSKSFIIIHLTGGWSPEKTNSIVLQVWDTRKSKSGIATKAIPAFSENALLAICP